MNNTSELNTYEYNGPVFFFGRFAGTYSTTTQAESIAAAKTNIIASWKAKNGGKLKESDGFAIIDKKIRRQT